MSKLTANKWKDKDGNEHVDYKIKKINDFGEGLMVGQKVTGIVKFEPEIRVVNYKKNGEPKSFNTSKIVLDDMNVGDFENVDNNEYGNVSLQVDGRLAEMLEDKQKDGVVFKGNKIEIFLEGFEKEIEGKTKKMSAWVFNVFNDGEPVKATYKKAEELKAVIDDKLGVPVAYKHESVEKLQAAVEKGELKREDIVEITMTDESKIEVKVDDVLRSVEVKKL